MEKYEIRTVNMGIHVGETQISHFMTENGVPIPGWKDHKEIYDYITKIHEIVIKKGIESITTSFNK